MKLPKKAPPIYDALLEDGLKRVRKGWSVRAASRSIDVSWSRLRRYMDKAVSARRVNGRWMLRDYRPREVRLFSVGQYKLKLVRGFTRASLVLRYMAAVERFINTNDVSQLHLFIGDGVKDIDGRWHPFETRPNQLYRLHAIDREPFEQIYRIAI